MWVIEFLCIVYFIRYINREAAGSVEKTGGTDY